MSNAEKDFQKEAIRDFFEKWKAQGGEYEFYEIAVGSFYGRGLTKEKALLEARRLYPGLYEKYRVRIGAGGKCHLQMVFQEFKDLHDEALKRN